MRVTKSESATTSRAVGWIAAALACLATLYMMGHLGAYRVLGFTVRLLLDMTAASALGLVVYGALRGLGRSRGWDKGAVPISRPGLGGIAPRRPRRDPQPGPSQSRDDR